MVVVGKHLRAMGNYEAKNLTPSWLDNMRSPTDMPIGELRNYVFFDKKLGGLRPNMRAEPGIELGTHANHSSSTSPSATSQNPRKRSAPGMSDAADLVAAAKAMDEAKKVRTSE